MKMSKILFLIILFFSKSIYAEYEENKEYRKNIVQNYRNKCEGLKPIEYRECAYDLLPKKCKVLIYSKSLDSLSSCLMGCGSAGIASKTLGDCSI